MRPYMTPEYLKSLEGNTYTSSDSDLKEYDGLKVKKVIRELTNDDYDRELIDDTDKNDKGEYRYLLSTMYEVLLENGETISVYEEEINPDYTGSWEKSSLSILLDKAEAAIDAGTVENGFIGSYIFEGVTDVTVPYEDFKLVKMYRDADEKERIAMDKVMVNLTGCTMETLLERALSF
ncbi:MAG: hypothetical protein ACI4FX_07640 [Agathobacter sp.]